MRLKKSLGTVALAAVMFFNTSGGAFSMEGLVAAVGPGVALLLTVLSINLVGDQLRDVLNPRLAR